jgi:hypothetical protein
VKAYLNHKVFFPISTEEAQKREIFGINDCNILNLFIIEKNEIKFINQTGIPNFISKEILNVTKFCDKNLSYNALVDLSTFELVLSEKGKHFLDKMSYYSYKIAENNHALMYYDFYCNLDNKILFRSDPGKVLQSGFYINDISLVYLVDFINRNILECIDLYNQSHHWEFDINVLRDFVPQWQDDRPNSSGQKPSDIKLGNRFYRYQDTVVTTVENPVFHDGRSAVRLIGIDVNNGQLKYISDYNCSRLIHNYESRLYMQQFRTIFEIDPQTGQIVSQLDFTDICSDLSASFLPELLHSEYNHFFAEQDFFIGDGVLCMAEFKDLNLVCIDLKTKKVVLHHKFEIGKDIDAEAYRIETPIYHNGKVYVNTCDPTCLYVFDTVR